MVPGDTLLLIDEIEFCKGSVSSLKDLSDRECLDIVVIVSCISSGLSEFGKNPKEWEERIDIRPLDFNEFLDAMDADTEIVESVMDSVIDGGKVRKCDCEDMDDLFRLYMVTGGMPAPVHSISRNRMIAEALCISRSILRNQMEDAFVFNRRISDIINHCVLSLPEQLAGNGRFTYSKVEGRVSLNRRYYSDGIEWLIGSGITTVCDRIDLPMDGPEPERIPTFYKLYIDSGTLACIMDSWVSDAMMNGSFDRCPCAVVENCIAGILRSDGYRTHYYSNDRKEADFVIRSESDVIGVAVRSRNNDRRKSIVSMMDSGLITRAVEFGTRNRPAIAENYPLFAAGFPERIFGPVGKCPPEIRRA